MSHRILFFIYNFKQIRRIFKTIKNLIISIFFFNLRFNNKHHAGAQFKFSFINFMIINVYIQVKINNKQIVQLMNYINILC